MHTDQPNAEIARAICPHHRHPDNPFPPCTCTAVTIALDAKDREREAMAAACTAHYSALVEAAGILVPGRSTALTRKHVCEMVMESIKEHGNPGAWILQELSAARERGEPVAWQVFCEDHGHLHRSGWRVFQDEGETKAFVERQDLQCPCVLYHGCGPHRVKPLYPCAKCKGKGVIADITRNDVEDCIVPCPDCTDDPGVVHIKGGDPDWCDTCDGSGIVYKGHDANCRCPHREGPCPACTSTGREA